MRNEHVYQNLMVQLDKLYRHTRQGSYQTRARYYEAMKRFCGFLADEYHLERLANLAPKHLEAYAAKLRREGKSPSTIKTDLSAIRFFHDQMASPRYQLPSCPATAIWSWSGALSARRTVPGATGSSSGCAPWRSWTRKRTM